MSLSLDNVVTVSVIPAAAGLANINTSALALITSEAPLAGASYGVSRQYLEPVSVGKDFGTSSQTYKCAVQVFAQNPNILTGGGYLVIIPRTQSAAATAATMLSAGPVDLTKLTATDYHIELTVDGGSATSVLIGSIDSSSIAHAQASLNSAGMISAGASFVVTGDITAAMIQLISGTTGSTSHLTVGVPGSGTDIAPPLGLSGVAVGAATGLERIKDAIVRTYQSVPYFGIIYDVLPVNTELLEIAQLVQSIDKIQFVGSDTSSYIAGIFTTIQGASLTNTRCLFYSTNVADTLAFVSGYASLALSTNFDGSNTVQTMHLKVVTGIVADPGMTQSLKDQCTNAGVDCYVDFGIPRIFSSGANAFYDSVYIALALKLRLKIELFNLLATVGTKIPQTEQGMSQAKSTVRGVMQLFVKNGSFAPGQWNSPTTFGNPGDHVRNIADFGFFIFSGAIADQSQTVRAARVAPLIQVAAKSSGAIHKMNLIATIEA